MLRIEKQNRGKEITFQFREKEPFFNPLLLKALGIAFLFHFGSFFIFHINPFQLTSTFLHPPVRVESDHIFSNGQIGLIQTPDLLSDAVGEIPANLWFEPLLVPVFENNSTLDPLSLWDNPFAELENRSIGYEPPHLLNPVQIHPIRMALSGALSQRKLLRYSKKLDETIAWKGGPQETVNLSYQVQVDDDTGKVFWFLKTDETQNSPFIPLAEQLLESLEFETGSPFINDTGKIDFAFFY